jgi:hypothetical protein
MLPQLLFENFEREAVVACRAIWLELQAKMGKHRCAPAQCLCMPMKAIPINKGDNRCNLLQ